VKFKPLLLASLVLAGCQTLPPPGPCPDEATVAAYLDDFEAKRVSKGFGKDITPDGARCARNRVIEAMPKVLGPRVGYIAVFTAEESQRRFGVSGPSWGAMFGDMMLRDSTLVSAQFGAKPRYEANLIVVVKDTGLADAESPIEALDHIDAVIPFIELPDFMLDQPTGPELVAVNAAFRGGVLGPRIPVQPTRAYLKMLEDMVVVVAEERTGKEVGRARGSALMGQPIRAALWLAKTLRREGVELKPGDLLSLGGFIPSAPVKPGTSMSVRYLGLPDNPVVIVHFD
jgi:2-keto-4-pentenoate hydratase